MQALLDVRQHDRISGKQAKIAREFWQALGGIIPQWQQAIRREVTSSFLRQQYVHAHGVMLVAIGIAGHELIATYPSDWQERLRVLADIDWSRKNTALWEGRAMVRSKMSKFKESIRLLVNVLKQALGLQLSAEEQRLERRSQ